MAYRVIRRSLGTGVALAGASAVTWASVDALPTQLVETAPTAVTVAVDTTAAVDYLPILASGVTGTVTNSVDALINKAPALWAQVAAQWPDAELTHLNYALVADMLLMPVAPYVFRPLTEAVTEVLAQQFPEHEAVIRQLPELSDEVAARLIGPWLSAIGAAGAVHEKIYYATTVGDVEGFFKAIADAPAAVIDGFLDGGYGDLSPLLTGEVGSQPIPAPGLLTPWGEGPEPRDLKWLPDEPETLVEDVEDAEITPAELEIADVAVVSEDDEPLVEASVVDEADERPSLRGVLRAVVAGVTGDDEPETDDVTSEEEDTPQDESADSDDEPESEPDNEDSEDKDSEDQDSDDSAGDD